MAELRIQDTLSGELRALEPREPGKVGIYACGPTVYSRIHIGNARPFVVFSLLKRFLEHQGEEVTLVMNVTDVNDKIYDAARATGVDSCELAAEMTAAYVKDTDALGLGRPDAEPKATETIEAIVALIGDLVERGHAYEAGGDVYFDVPSFEGYGRLSNRPLEDMQQGEGDDAAAVKRSPQDFALWKASKEGEDTSWPSPWGEGRPGWHIECSAMAEELLGLDFDIHGGGSDLVFPHHENEIAQTEAARSRPLARLWMHNGMLETTSEEKMAKSEGNTFLLHEAVAAFGREAVVDFLVSGHYRQPLAFSDGALTQAQARVERIRNFARGVDFDGAAPGGVAAAALEAFLAALADDFNTAKAVGELFGLVAEVNRGGEDVPGVGTALATMLGLVGLESLLEAEDGPDAEAQELLAEREEARGARDFDRADAARDALRERGWEVRDTPEGPKLVRAP
ncbi:MAG: cysteine--tRNA ligase [Thermoleophilaceae bacterium]|nr:cysteine--tRNA ligase [Thermoleophilaceae bacterium]